MASIYADNKIFEIVDPPGLRAVWLKRPYDLAAVMLETESYVAFLEGTKNEVPAALLDGRKLLLEWCRESLCMAEYLLLLHVMEHIR